MGSGMSVTREELRSLSSSIDNLMDLGRREEAEKLLNQALEASADDQAYNLFFQAEAALYLRGDHRARQLLLSEGVKEAPEDPFLLRNLGGGYLMDERFAKAHRLFNKALELDPRNADTLCSIGLFFSAKGRESRAISWFKKAVAVKSDDNDSLRQIGVCYSKLGNDREAINWYEQAIASCAEDYDAMRQLGVSWAMLKNYDTALAWLNKALQVNPEDLDSKRNLRLVEKKKSGKGTTFIDRLMIRLARRMTLTWRRFIDRIDQLKKDQP